MKDYDFHEFRCFGTQIRLYMGEPASSRMPPTAIAAAHVRAFFQMMERHLSRFLPDSELSRLNASPVPAFEASRVLRLCVSAALGAAESTGGLIDPTVIDDLETAGYRESLADAKPAPIREALAAAPCRRPARPSPKSRWREVSVDDEAGVIHRPPGVRIDSGGVGKGLAADLAATGLKGMKRVIVDCGGDMRAIQEGPGGEPFEIRVEHPLTGNTATKLTLKAGGISTSGIGTRIWRTGAGYSHHLIDPASGRPAWTGVVQATAVAPTALKAETISKLALLTGPVAARQALNHFGGALVLEDGSVEVFKPRGSELPSVELERLEPANLEPAALEPDETPA